MFNWFISTTKDTKNLRQIALEEKYNNLPWRWVVYECAFNEDNIFCPPSISKVKFEKIEGSDRGWLHYKWEPVHENSCSGMLWGCGADEVFESEEKAIEKYKEYLKEYQQLLYSQVSDLLKANGLDTEEKEEKNLLDDIIQRIDIQNNITFSSGKNTTLLNLAYCQSELGELATEVLTSLGHGGKEAGKDGIFGESVDLIITAIAIMLSTNPNITSQDILDKLDEKVKKWENKNKQNGEDIN